MKIVRGADQEAISGYNDTLEEVWKTSKNDWVSHLVGVVWLPEFRQFTTTVVGPGAISDLLLASDLSEASINDMLTADQTNQDIATTAIV